MVGEPSRFRGVKRAFVTGGSGFVGGRLIEVLRSRGVEVVALARSGAIRTEVHRVALEDAVEGYRQLRRGAIRGRAVVTP